MAQEVFVRPTFEQVYAETSQFVRRCAERLGVTSSSVEDVVQEVYLTVYRRFEQFQGTSSLQTWVFGILSMLVRNHRRWLRRKGSSLAISAQVTDPEILPDGTASPFELASRGQARSVLVEQMSRLDRASVTILLLSDLEGMTAAEIAASTDTKLHTVYSRRRAARKALKQSLRQRGVRPLLS